MIQRIIKITLLTITSLLSLVIMLWCGVVWFILTPEFVTPHVEGIIQLHSKGDVSIKSVDLSLFDRFPNISLRVDSLRITQTKDSISDLLFARRCNIEVNTKALLDKSLDVEQLSLEHASIYLYVDSLHGPLKSFILPEEREVEKPDSLESEIDLSDYKLQLRRFRIDSTNITIDDRTKLFYSRIENLGVDMSMNLAERQSDLDLEMGFSNFLLWQEGDLLVKKTSMDLKSKLFIDRDSMVIRFDSARMRLNNIDLRTRGVLHRDTINRGIMVDVHSSLNTPSITEFLALIPPTIINSKEKITTQGAVQLDLTLKGLYSDTSTPLIEANLKIDNAKAKYESRKLELERVDCDTYMFVDLNNPTRSYLDINNLHINTSEIIDLTMSGKVKNMIEDPEVDLNIISDFDFDRFSEIFPFKDGIICKGRNTSNLDTQFKVSDLENSRYADIYIDGESTFHNLEVSIDASKFLHDTTSLASLYLHTERGQMIFGDNILSESNSRTLRSTANFSDLRYLAKSGEYMSVKDIELVIGANFDRKSSQVNGVGVRGIAKRVNAGVDSLFNSELESSDIKLIIMPKNEKHNTRIDASISSQQITANEPIYNSNIALSTVDMEMSIEKIKTQRWTTNGEVSFTNFEMLSDLYPAKIKIPETKISVGNQIVRLDNAHVMIGDSEVVATGYINNLLRKVLVNPHLPLSGELAIQAPMLDFGELIEVSNNSALMIEEEAEMAADDLAAEKTNQADSSMMFIVPRKMDFIFDLNIDQAKIWDAVVDNFEGRATIKGGTLTLDRLKLNAIGAEAVGEMVYRNINLHSSNVAGNISLKSVDINRIGELIPSINTMFPMLKSFEGVVDFDFKANTNIDQESMIEIPTLYSAMRFKGRDLVLMDSETFTDLSKKLMFKNKDRNMIDSLEIFALVEESTVDVLPFPITIDRYKAVIGGSQVIDPESFDVNYGYHISIVKSPLPFKAGVDIEGNLEDFDFKITKAKLKKSNFEEQRMIYEEYRDSIDATAEALNEDLEQRSAKIKAKRKKRRAAQAKHEQETEAEIEAEERDSIQ